MRKEFSVDRTHRYGDQKEVPVEFSLRGNQDFDQVKRRVLKEFKLDDPEKAIFTGIHVEQDDKSQLHLQTNETCEITNGARVSVLLKKEFDGTIKTHIAPNHHIWDSSRPGVENVSRGVRDSLQSFLKGK